MLGASVGIALVIAVAVASNADARSRLASCPDARTALEPALVTPARAEASMTCLINRVRRGRGLSRLRPSPILTAAARSHAVDMHSAHMFSHDSSDGTDFATRMRRHGYPTPGWRAGENIAWGSFPTIKSLVVAWMQSPSHRRQILEPRYREIGAGSVWGAQYYSRTANALIATVDFGVRP